MSLYGQNGPLDDKMGQYFCGFTRSLGRVIEKAYPGSPTTGIGESDRGRDREFFEIQLSDLLNENCLSSCLSERKAVEFNAAGGVEAGGARSAQTCSRSRSFEQRSSDRVKLTWVPVRRREVRSLTCWPHRPARGRCGCGSRCSMRESQRQWAQCAPMIVRSTIVSGLRVSGSVWIVVACSSCPSVPLGHMQGRQHCLP